MATQPGPSLKGCALQWLAQREHSRIELRRKLLAHISRQAAATEDADAAAGSASGPQFARRTPPTPEQQASVDALLDWLAAHQHLSEARFVEGRVRARSARHGNLRIRQELAQHGLKLAPAEAQALVESEFERARQVWSRKFDGLPTDAAGRARQMRFLAGRGFSAAVIGRLLRGDDD